MAWQTYKGLSVPSGPTGDAGLNIKENFTELADRIGICNFIATTDPGVGDDINDGYTVGSKWYNQSADRVWECLDSTGGAAVWVDLTSNLNYPATYFPKRSSLLFHETSIFVLGNPFISTLDALQPHGLYASQNPGANSDEWTNSCFLAAGIYTLVLMGFTDDESGKLDISVKSYTQGSFTTVVSAQDWYSASDTRSVIKIVSSIVIPANGAVVVKGKVNGKNASSTGYKIALTYFYFVQSSD